MIAGFYKAIFYYRCKWCNREETVTRGEGETDMGVLDGWRTFDYSYGPALDLCSSDCEREKDIAIQQALANVEPTPGPGWPPGFWEEFERLRQESRCS